MVDMISKWQCKTFVIFPSNIAAGSPNLGLHGQTEDRPLNSPPSQRPKSDQHVSPFANVSPITQASQDSSMVQQLIAKMEADQATRAERTKGAKPR